MNFSTFYHRGRNSEVCPYNMNILCTEHKGQYPPNLPECCECCGWNPAEWQRRIKEVNSKHGMEGWKTTAPEVS